MRIQLPKWLKRSERPTPPPQPVRPRWSIYDSITVTISVGSDVTNAIEETIRLAREHEVEVTFDFNGVLITVASDSEPKLIRRDWDRALNGYIDKKVGPHPNPVLTDEEKANDARIKAENERRREEESAEYWAKEAEKRSRVEARMANAPAMEFSDEEGWRKSRAANADSYGAGIMDYAERWARMMQLEMAEGKTLEEVWQDTSFEADLEGMSGATQGVATHLLTQCWVHGAELRRLHNARWGVSDTSGTVNPAIISVGRSN